jgi:hypothetical protein
MMHLSVIELLAYSVIMVRMLSDEQPIKMIYVPVRNLEVPNINLPVFMVFHHFKAYFSSA